MFHKYYIKHTKTPQGKDKYEIMHSFLGLKFPLYEETLYRSCCWNNEVYIEKIHYTYDSLEAAKKSLDTHLSKNKEQYRGYKITKMHDGEYVVKDLNIDYNSERIKYNISGSLESCKLEIDQALVEKINKRFKEIIEI